VLFSGCAGCSDLCGLALPVGSAFAIENPNLAFPHDDPLYSIAMNSNSLTIPQLKEAIAIKEKIEALEQELASILGTPVQPAKTVPAMPVEVSKRKKRKMSAAAKARIAATQRERWAKKKGLTDPGFKPAIVVATVKEVPAVKFTVRPVKVSKPAKKGKAKGGKPTRALPIPDQKR
jgi:hypothetical protein